jgi:hypothetical protein
LQAGSGLSHYDLLSILIIPSSILVASALFLWPSPTEFPMDDTYIHLVYAGNLSEQGKLFFNNPDEKGVGTSSVLWTLILAGEKSLGLPMHTVAKLAGVASLVTVGLGLYLLLRPILPGMPALVGSLAVALSGHMLWFALSGMETMLFLALAILALLCYRNLRWGLLGVLLGLLMLARLEGIFLAVAIGAVDILRHKTIRRGLLLAGVICTFIGGSWILYLFLRTGNVLPTSGIGKRFSNAIGIQAIAGRNQSLALLSLFPALVYPLTWFLYIIEFVLGGIALPPPKLVINPGLGSIGFPLSIWAILGWAAVILPLCLYCVGWARRSVRKPGWFQDERHLPLVVFFVWVVLHNLAYMVLFPSIGTASRYGMLNHVALWLILLFGLWRVDKPSIKLWLVAGLTVIAFANTLYWNKVYDANLEHMLQVRISAADYIRENIPQSEKCAAYDVGAIRFYSGRPIIDLGGLIDPSLIQRYLDGKLDRYLISNGVTCLILPGRTGRTSDGWFDFAEELGLVNSTMFTMQQNSVFQIDRERWLLGYLPVNNYQSTVTIYRLVKNE